MKRWNINLIQKYLKNDYIDCPEIHGNRKDNYVSNNTSGLSLSF